MRKFLLKLFVFTCIIISVILYCDSEGIFDPDKKNDHTIKKWNAFYDFTEWNNVDVILVGNSHLYTGINPKTLSNYLGVNSFILASPGTNIADSYYCLVEALKKTKPSIVVVETYGINQADNHELKGGALSDQFKSFSARKDFWIKIKSSPELFTIGNIPYAWSNTLRNHRFLFTNKEQIKKNKKEDDEVIQKKLYLGRYARFKTGITDSLLNIYKTKGAPVDGKKYQLSDQNKTYVKKIVELCEEENIKLVFLTLPMYQEHVSNYKIWRERLNNELSQYKLPWIDLQLPEYNDQFTVHCFENTYNTNQHMTYNGSLLASYMLGDFINKQYPNVLPSRKGDQNWKNLFYGEEGYFDNNSPRQTDNENMVLAKNVQASNIIIEEINFIKVKNNYLVVAKIPINPTLANEIKNYILRISINFSEGNNPPINSNLDLPYDQYSSSEKRVLFKQGVKPIKIHQINYAQLVPKTTINQ